MITFIYINSFNTFNLDDFANKLSQYDSISNVMVIDNTLDSTGRTLLLEKLESLELPNTSYIVNDSYLTFGAVANQYLAETNTEILFVTPSVSIKNVDIKEMLRIMDLSEHHVFVIPRSNVGHYQMIPVSHFINKDNTDSLTETECRKIAKNLPEYTLMPGAYDGCVLMRSSQVFTLSGMCDDYMTQYLTLFDYSILMNNYAFNTVAANHAYASNVKEICPSEAESHDMQLLASRFEKPINEGTNHYLNFDISPQDKYSDILFSSNTNRIKKLLYYIPHISESWNGSAVHAINILDGLYASKNDNWEISVVINESTAEYFDLKNKYDITFYNPNNVTGLFDIGFAPYHVFTSLHFGELANHCLKIVAWPLDIIIDRSSYMWDIDIIKVHELVACYSDGLMFLSKAAQSDYNLYFNAIDNIKKIPQKVSYILPQPVAETLSKEPVPFKEYYLLFGNTYLHKMIQPTISIISQMSENFVIVGAADEGYLTPNIYTYKSGGLSDEFISKLYQECNALIFPSIYEGFGIPVIQALNAGKNVYLMNNTLNHELEALEDSFKHHMFYMNNIWEFPELLKKTKEISGPLTNLYKRSWIDVALDCWKLIDDVLTKDVDYCKIYMRSRLLNN